MKFRFPSVARPGGREGLSSGQATATRPHDNMKTTRTVTKTTLKFTAALLCAGCLLTAESRAAELRATKGKSDLAIALTAQRVVKQSDGSEKLLVADRALPGEMIQYDTLCQNQGAKALNNVAPMLPIPAGMVYVDGSASPAPSEASLDGKSFSPIPLKRQVTMPTGEVTEQEVPATEYRALRWQLGELAPGAKTVLVARTRIAANN